MGGAQCFSGTAEAFTAVEAFVARAVADGNLPTVRAAWRIRLVGDHLGEGRATTIGFCAVP